jgi:hypothetical protein
MGIKRWWQRQKTTRPRGAPQPHAAPDALDWSSQPGFHERKLQIRYNNPFFPEACRSVSQRDLASAKDADAAMFRHAEEGVAGAIADLEGMGTVKLDELAGLRREMEQMLRHVSACGPRADGLVRAVRAMLDYMRKQTDEAAVDANPSEADRIRYLSEMVACIQEFQRHTAYIDATHAEPHEWLPTLLSFSAGDLRFLFQEFPPNDAFADLFRAWRKTKADLRAFAVDMMEHFPEAREKLLKDPPKLELLGINSGAPPPPALVDIEALSQRLFSKNPDPEYKRTTAALLDEAKRRFGAQAPVDQLYRLIRLKEDSLKARMKQLTVEAADKGASVQIDELERGMSKSRADYTGEEAERFGAQAAEWIVSLRAQYGERIPLLDLVRILQELERAIGVTDSVHQFPLE